MKQHAGILVFDVNETLLDLGALDSRFADAFGDAAARQEWFNLLLQGAFVANITDAYRDFASIARSALKMVAARHEREIDGAAIEHILEGVKTLPAHPDVPDALRDLSDAGFALVALTQSPLATLEAQFANAGLTPHFERLFSADEVRRFKPDPAPYRMVAERMQCGTGDLRLIAAHGWDIAGAMRAGCKAAFVARPGQVLDPELPAPDIVGTDIGEVALELLGNAGAIKA